MATPDSYPSLLFEAARSQYDYLFQFFESSPTQLNYADIELQKPNDQKPSTFPPITTSHPNSSLRILLFASLLFNVVALALFFSGSFRTNSDPPYSASLAVDLTWTTDAANAAEAAALYTCSGNGDVFVDTPSFANGEDEVLCECYECFTGPQCNETVDNCTVRFAGGDLALLHSYWKQYQRNQSAVVISGYYRPSYRIVEDNSNYRFLPVLEEEIRKLHELVGNAVTKDRYILFGTGSIQLVNAAISSYSQENDGTFPMDVVAAAPYYFLFRGQTEMFQTKRYRWAGDANNWTHPANTSAIEIVTDPSNPIGDPVGAVLPEETSIYDYAYYWPHFTAITEAADEEVMLFSITKSLGFAGTRIGWAIVKNETIYNRLLSYISNNIIEVSHESQLKAFQLIRAVNNAYASELASSAISPSLSPTEYGEKGLVFHYAYSQLRYRWVTVSEVLQASDRFSLQDLDTQYCNFFEAEHYPSPAFAWIRCNRLADTNCSDVFQEARITVRPGSIFESTNDHVRLSLMTRIASFEIMIQYLKVLVLA